ncbi:hypothetical protein FACS189472_17320 [Alphaproteobacteria bacterium]|nr:hypothetical protein FACS189472_17320 [Alphaproteobacteria bacterium]
MIEVGRIGKKLKSLEVETHTAFGCFTPHGVVAAAAAAEAAAVGSFVAAGCRIGCSEEDEGR